jgi:hypothetical protein
MREVAEGRTDFLVKCLLEMATLRFVISKGVFDTLVLPGMAA